MVLNKTKNLMLFALTLNIAFPIYGMLRRSLARLTHAHIFVTPRATCCSSFSRNIHDDNRSKILESKNLLTKSKENYLKAKQKFKEDQQNFNSAILNGGIEALEIIKENSEYETDILLANSIQNHNIQENRHTYYLAESIDNEDGCPFCAYQKQERSDVENRVLKRFKNFIAIMATNPNGVIHIIVVPYNHASSLSSLSRDEKKELGQIILSLLINLQNKFGDACFNMEMNLVTKTFNVDEKHLQWHIRSCSELMFDDCRLYKVLKTVLENTNIDDNYPYDIGGLV